MAIENKIRLVVCTTCSSVEEIPDYEGPWQNDTWLNEKLKGHMLPSGEKTHGEVHVVGIDGNIWMTNKNDALAWLSNELTPPGQGLGLGQTLYDAKDNYSADAMRCWRIDHQRTTNCGDYRSDKKRILPDTAAERKAEGITTKRPNIFLCDFCPYQQIINQRRDSEEFKYNYNI